MAEEKAAQDYLPWTEKYRPQKLSDVVGQKDVVESLKAYVKAGNMPNMLFAGPPGIGKTTCALALAHELFGKEIGGNFLELNASVTADTPVLVKINGKIKRTNFEWLAKHYFEGDETRKIVENLEVLSLTTDNYTTGFSRADYIFRHKVKNIIEITYEGGKVKTSLNHSIMVFDDDGNLVSKLASEIKRGDLLVTFKSMFGGELKNIDVSAYKPQGTILCASGIQKNPKVYISFNTLEADDDLAWSMGLYMAEGCTAFRGETSGQVIYTLGYPNPKDAQHIERLLGKLSCMGIKASTALHSSGFDRSKLSSIQVRACNTQLASFFFDTFYGNSDKHTAREKRVPDFIFNLSKDKRLAFIKGYWNGDGAGDWDSVARICSVSTEGLTDVVWLGRISGLETSVFHREARIIKENAKFSYVKSELLPSSLFFSIARKCSGKIKYLLRHSLYSKKSRRVSKKVAKQILEIAKQSGEDIRKLLKLVESDLYVVEVKETNLLEYDDYVYDVSVPGSQVFWGGTTPILLHNSDERGIDVVRGRIKDFARSVSLGGVPFKLIFLDEGDALTADAQQALRRTMESNARVTRFIISANYSSKIIEPIQSRCAVFRFLPIDQKEVKKAIESIAKEEKLKMDDSAYDAIYYVSEGDMRRVVNLMQGAAMHSNHITEELVHKISSRARPKEVKEMVELAISGNFKSARELLDKLIIHYGLSGEDVLFQIYRELPNLAIAEEKKVLLIDRVGEYNFRLVQGANERIQIEALLAHFASIGKK